MGAAFPPASPPRGRLRAHVFRRWQHSPTQPRSSARGCDFAFLPNDLHVKVGGSVTWLNCEPPGTPSHTTTSNQGVWNSPLLEPGAAFTQTFNTPGVFAYICAVHPFMTASITVE